MNIDSSIWDLIAKQLAGELSLDEAQQLRSWLEENPDHREIVAQLNHIWQRAGQTGEITVPDQEIVWQKLEQQLNLDQPSEVLRPLKTDGNRRKAYLLAAGGILAALIMAILIMPVDYFGKTENQGNLTPRAVVNHAKLTPLPDNIVSTKLSSDSSQVYMLPDKSRVWLNKNSQISYLPDFGDSTRSLRLKGEAFFEIRPDQNRPFIIYAGGSQTKVIGTAFNLKAYESEDPVLTVVSGKVEFAEESSDRNKVVLIKGEKATLLKKEHMLVKQKNDMHHFLDWKHVLVYQKEIARPASYLRNSARWKKSIINQTEIKGQIRNVATLATYENVKLRVSYRKKRKKRSYTFTVYKSLGPGETIKYKYRLADWFSKTKDLQIEVIDASVAKN